MKDKIKKGDEKMCKTELNEMLATAIQQVKDAGIKPYDRIIPKVRLYPARSYFGLCTYKRKIDSYEITISEYHLDNPKKAVMETLVHEVLHTTEDTRAHCNRWKEYVAMMNKKYGYNISRCGSSKNGCTLPKSKEEVRYIIKCTNCGKEYKRKRKSKAITQTERYRCGICRGRLARVK